MIKIIPVVVIVRRKRKEQGSKNVRVLALGHALDQNLEVNIDLNVQDLGLHPIHPEDPIKRKRNIN